MELAREAVIREHFVDLVAELILCYDRQNRILAHQQKYELVQNQILHQILFLNSVKHPGYVVFFFPIRNDDDDDEFQNS